MKRITKIEIENSRAYYDRLSFSLERGENLLIYGENGSGKSSLYKSLNDFILSFHSPVNYVVNRYKAENTNGEVLLSIGDYNDHTGIIENILDYRYAHGVDNTQIADTAFLKALVWTKGFLNYKDLLKVYLYEENNPNLFDFFIRHLLKDHVASAQGLDLSLASEWGAIRNDLFNVYNRYELKHRRGLKRLEEFEKILKNVLDDLFNEVNLYLTKYFHNFGLNIDYILKPMTFEYGKKGKSTWKIKEDLRLKVSIGNSSIEGFIEGLNEARLSAIAICLYLAALRANPGKELRLMFLDDIFIGIDSSNRWSILKILEQEFNDFQIILATYDRSWYCLAKNYLNSHKKDSWKFINLYSQLKKDKEHFFFVPIMTAGISDYDKAKEYLHSNRSIDLPAAANYFRKTLEELISEKHLPKELFLGEDYSLIPGYKLNKHIGALMDLFIKIGIDTTNIRTINSYLYPLLHPLSHYEEEAQVYRNELIAVEDAIKFLYGQIENLLKSCQLLLGRSNVIEIRYKTIDNSYEARYKIQLDDNLWLYKDIEGVFHLTKCNCKCIKMTGLSKGENLKPFVPNKKLKNYKNFLYESLDEALNNLYNYEVNINKHNVIPHNDYDIVYRLLGDQQDEPFVNKRNNIMENMLH